MSLRKIAKELEISASYLSDIINGKKGCTKELMEKIIEYYPNLDFYNFIEPRYKVRLEENRYEKRRNRNKK